MVLDTIREDKTTILKLFSDDFGIITLTKCDRKPYFIKFMKKNLQFDLVLMGIWFWKKIKKKQLFIAKE